MFLSTNPAVMTSAKNHTSKCVNIAKTTPTVVANLDKEIKLNHMTDGTKCSVRLTAGWGNLRPLSLEVY